MLFISSLCRHFFQQKQQLPDMEFGRRMATERDLEKTDTLRFSNVGNELFKMISALVNLYLFFTMYHIEPYKDGFPSSTTCIMPPEKLLLVRVKPLAEIRLC